MTLSSGRVYGIRQTKDPINNSGYWTSSQNELEYHDGRNNFRYPIIHRLDLGINIYRPKKTEEWYMECEYIQRI